MKTVIIHGQNHKGSSYHIGRLVADGLARQDEIKEFFLPRDLNHFCLGCYKCLDEDEKCPFYREKKVIMDAIEQADLLVFTTPTYCFRASAPMKSFIDMTYINWLPHRPKPCMFKKKAVVVSTAAGAGYRKAMKDITTCLSYWGIPYIRTIGFAVLAKSWNEVSEKTKQSIDRKVDKTVKAISRKNKVHTSIKIRFLFNLMRLGNKNTVNDNTPLSADYKYWKNQGWFDGKRPY